MPHLYTYISTRAYIMSCVLYNLMILLYYLPLSVFHYNVIRFICIVFLQLCCIPIYLYLSINQSYGYKYVPFHFRILFSSFLSFQFIFLVLLLFSPVLISYIIIFIYRNYKILQSYNENTIYYKIEIKKKRNTKILKPRNNKKA